MEVRAEVQLVDYAIAFLTHFGPQVENYPLLKTDRTSPTAFDDRRAGASAVQVSAFDVASYSH